MTTNNTNFTLGEIYDQIDHLIDKVSEINWGKLSKFEKSTLSDEIEQLSGSVNSILKDIDQAFNH